MSEEQAVQKLRASVECYLEECQAHQRSVMADASGVDQSKLVDIITQLVPVVVQILLKVL